MSRSGKSVSSIDFSVLVALFAAEGSAAMAALGLYKRGARPLGEFLRAAAGYAVIAAGLVLLACIAFVVWRYRRHTDQTRLGFAAAAALNVVSVVLALASAEVVIRVMSVPAPVGRAFAGRVLLPKSWSNVAARERAILARAETSGSYLVFDEQLGWSIGRNRTSRDPYRRYRPDSLRERGAADVEIYHSGPEGIRTRTPGASMGTRRPAHRIALVGDSFTFGLEVKYEDTWGSRLETALGSDTQVINFGVDGYGVDQILLRYQRDVVPWHPDIVIFGMIDDDLRRSMCVYAFLCFQTFGEIPFPKPRFVVTQAGPRQLNAPLPRPESIFVRPSIAELPFVEYEISYDPMEWQQGLVHHSYLARFIISRFPRWPQPRPQTSDEARTALNAALLNEFLRLARENGSQPIVVAFPTKREERGTLATMFDPLRVPYYDMSSCVQRVPVQERFVFLHYAAAANAAIADCLTDSVRHLTEMRRQTRTAHHN